VAKTAIKNHILKEHNGGDERCALIKAEGAHNKGYWLYFSVPLNATLSVVDNFLRQIWCECCDHMSAFRSGYDEFGKSFKLSSFYIGATLLYLYDFGSTTEILVTVVDNFSRPSQRGKVQLLARNVPPQEECAKCGAPATQINVWEGETLCDDCADSVDDDGVLRPITNSPRCGECAYAGEEDRWTFVPARPLRKPAASPAKGRRGRRASPGK
jgi:Zn finger protein HypA/HybF involved in hydrogenase expression